MARIRSAPEDFRVTELPLYPASGEGGHTFVTIEKTMRTTEEVVADLARKPRDRPGLDSQRLGEPLDVRALAPRMVAAAHPVANSGERTTPRESGPLDRPREFFDADALLLRGLLQYVASNSHGCILNSRAQPHRQISRT